MIQRKANKMTFRETTQHHHHHTHQIGKISMATLECFIVHTFALVGVFDWLIDWLIRKRPLRTTTYTHFCKQASNLNQPSRMKTFCTFRIWMGSCKNQVQNASLLTLHLICKASKSISKDWLTTVLDFNSLKGACFPEARSLVSEKFNLKESFSRKHNGKRRT